MRYLEGYAEKLSSPIKLGVQVDRVDRNDAVWCLQTSKSELLARQVVIATGRQRTPGLPDWPRQERFSVQIIHASQFGDVE